MCWIRVRGCHPLRPVFPGGSTLEHILMARSFYPEYAETSPVWAFSLSIATTQEIDFSFFSCRY